MKTIVLLLFISTFFLAGCEKVKVEHTGTITGTDARMCVCCGGYFIDIAGTDYRFEKSGLPGNFTFTDQELPLTVELDWELKDGGCAGFNWISISKIRRN